MTAAARVGIRLACTVSLLLLAPGAAAHAHLEASTPEPGGTVQVGAGVLALRFSERIEPGHSTATLTGDGGRVPARLDVPDDRPAELRVLTDPLEGGVYRLDWSVLSLDGHASSGSLHFAVGDASAPEDVRVSRDGAGGVAAEGVLRAAMLFGALTVLGLAVSSWDDRRMGHDAVGRATRVAAWMAAGGGVAALALVALLRVEAGPGWSLPGALGLAKALLLFGAAGLLHAAARRPGPRPALAALAALAVFLVLVLHSVGGHGVLARASRESVAGHVASTLHLAAAGVWVGGLLGVLLQARSASARDLAGAMHAFTPLATLGVVLLAASGAYQAVVHLDSWSDLGTPYGRTLSAKLALAAVALGFGAHHRRLATRAEAPVGATRRSLRRQWAVLACVVVASGFLGAVAPPAPAVGEGPGPLAVLEDVAEVEGFSVRLLVHANPPRAGEAVDLELRVTGTSSHRPGDVIVEAGGVGPGWAAGAVGPSTATWWSRGVVWDDAGEATVAVRIDHPATGPQEASFRVPVQA